MGKKYAHMCIDCGKIRYTGYRYRNESPRCSRCSALKRRSKSRKPGCASKRNRYYRVYDGKKRVLEHRLLVERQLGRKLKSTEIVHHIDFDGLNNNFDNLLLCENNVEHKDIESTIFNCLPILMKSSIVYFDKISKQYHINPGYIKNIDTALQMKKAVNMMDVEATVKHIRRVDNEKN